jgi:hypothetical protein
MTLLPAPILKPVREVEFGDCIFTDFSTDAMVTQSVLLHADGSVLMGEDILTLQVWQRGHYGNGMVGAGTLAPTFYSANAVVLVWTAEMTGVLA